MGITSQSQSRKSRPPHTPSTPVSLCLPAPGRYFAGVPSSVKHPGKMDMVILRENTEDILRRDRLPGRIKSSPAPDVEI